MKKKLLGLIMVIAVTASLTACGGSKADSAPAEAAPAQTETAAEPEEAAEAEYTEEQQALAEEFMAMAEDYDAVVEKINANEELLADQDFINQMNELSDEIIAADDYFSSPDNLTPEVISAIRDAIKATNDFIAQADELLAEYENGGGAQELTVPIQIVNNTGVDIYALALSPTNSSDWGDNLITEVIEDGDTVAGELVFTADTLAWDILIQDSEGSSVTFTGVDFSDASVDGAQLVLSEEDGNYYAQIVE